MTILSTTVPTKQLDSWHQTVMAYPRLAPLLGYSLFLTVLWYHTGSRTTSNASPWLLSAFWQRLFWLLLPCLLLAFLGLAETWFKALVLWLPKPLQRCHSPTLTAFCQVNFYSHFIFLLFGNSTTCLFSIFWWVQLSFHWFFFFFSLFQVLPSLGDQTSVFMLTVSLALVFHSMNLNSWIAVSFQLSYWLLELFSPVSTQSFHTLQSLLAFLLYIPFFPLSYKLSNEFQSPTMFFSLPFPLPNCILPWFPCLLFCDDFHFFTFDCNQCVFFFFLFSGLAVIISLPWFTLRTQ